VTHENEKKQKRQIIQHVKTLFLQV
jgi:hypothetical protein